MFSNRLTGFNSKQWEKDMKAFLPSFMEVTSTTQERLKTIRNALVVVDELDVGSRKKSVLHKLLKSAGLWNVEKSKNVDSFSLAHLDCLSLQSLTIGEVIMKKFV